MAKPIVWTVGVCSHTIRTPTENERTNLARDKPLETLRQPCFDVLHVLIHIVVARDYPWTTTTPSNGPTTPAPIRVRGRIDGIVLDEVVHFRHCIVCSTLDFFLFFNSFLSVCTERNKSSNERRPGRKFSIWIFPN